MTWWWELFDTGNMTPYFNGVRQISDEMLKAGNGSFEQFKLLTGNIESYGKKCGSKYFIYLLNNMKRLQHLFRLVCRQKRSRAIF